MEPIRGFSFISHMIFNDNQPSQTVVCLFMHNTGYFATGGERQEKTKKLKTGLLGCSYGP